MFLANILRISMPNYDYKCMNCFHTFEIFQPISAEPLKVCPECNGEVKRLIGSGLSPIFKGKGFYQTDYKSAKKSDSKSTASNNTQAKSETNNKPPA